MSFDPNNFLNTVVNEPNSTQMVACPAGEYNALLDSDIKVRQFQGTKDPSKTYTSLDLQWLIDDPAVCNVTGRTPTKVRQSLMLDITPNGGLATGKGENVGLGRLRDAVGLNTPGQPFSFSMLPGKMAKVGVTQRVDGDQIYAEVKTVARLA